MFTLYRFLLLLATPLLWLYLRLRAAKGKEETARLSERYGKTNAPRPPTTLIWLHAASVGEAQAALSIINAINNDGYTGHWLLTSGTVTSSHLIQSKNLANLQHQYIPLDHPIWVNRFLNHWKPDLAIWLESEIWPTLVNYTKRKDIPLILVNARLSDSSYNSWLKLKSISKKTFPLFDLILTQSQKDTDRFNALGGAAVTTGNIKLTITPLSYNEAELTSLKQATKKRPLWLYASSHKGEEEIAAHIHQKLKVEIPDLLTIIVPRHPERANDIEKKLKPLGLNITKRSNDNNLPTENTDIYLADTLGELGLFYSLSTITMIGRSLSDDGGGGHNPIEAAQLNCAILTGPNIQYQTLLFDPLFTANAATQVMDEEELFNTLRRLFDTPNDIQQMIDNASAYLSKTDNAMDAVMAEIKPYLLNMIEP